MYYNVNEKIKNKIQIQKQNQEQIHQEQIHQIRHQMELIHQVKQERNQIQ